MSEEREPVRLRDDPNEDRGLRDALEATRGESAGDAMLAGVLAGVLASGGGGGRGGGGAAAKIVAAVGAVAIGAAVIALVASSSTTPTPTPVRAPIDAALVADAFVEPDAAPSVDAGTDAFVRIARLVPHPPPTTIAEPLESDGALLMRATREHDAVASLALALDHRARFPTSASSEDREGLVVLDLARLNRAAEARAAADVFFARWPRSAARTNIETALARMH